MEVARSTILSSTMDWDNIKKTALLIGNVTPAALRRLSVVELTNLISVYLEQCNQEPERNMKAIKELVDTLKNEDEANFYGKFLDCVILAVTIDPQDHRVACAMNMFTRDLDWLKDNMGKLISELTKTGASTSARGIVFDDCVRVLQGAVKEQLLGAVYHARMEMADKIPEPEQANAWTEWNKEDANLISDYNFSCNYSYNYN